MTEQLDKIDIVDGKVNIVLKVVDNLKNIVEKLQNKSEILPMDINGDGIIDQKEKQIYDYYNNSMEKMQSHYIWGRVIDTLFTLGLVLLSIFAF